MADDSVGIDLNLSVGSGDSVNCASGSCHGPSAYNTYARQRPVVGAPGDKCCFVEHTCNPCDEAASQRYSGGFEDTPGLG